MNALAVAAASVSLIASLALPSSSMPAGAREHAQLPQRLNDTGLFAVDRAGTIASHNRQFVPQYPFWSDGMTKRR